MAHPPERGAERDWLDTRCQVASKGLSLARSSRREGALEVAGGGQAEPWKCGGQLGLLPKSK